MSHRKFNTTLALVISCGLTVFAQTPQFNIIKPSTTGVPGEEVRVRMKSREMASVMSAMDQSTRGAPLSWIAVDRDTFSGRMLERPQRTSIPIAAQEQLVVELYSK